LTYLQESSSRTVCPYTHHTLSAGGALVLGSEGFVEADAAEKVATGRHQHHLWRREALQGFHAHRALRRLQSTRCWSAGKVIGVVLLGRLGLRRMEDGGWRRMVSVEVHLPLHGWHLRVERWLAWLHKSWAPNEGGKQRSNLVAVELQIGSVRVSAGPWTQMLDHIVLHSDRGCRAAPTLWRVVGCHVGLIRLLLYALVHLILDFPRLNPQTLLCRTTFHKFPVSP